MVRAHALAFGDIPDVSLKGIFSRTRARAETVAAEFGIEGIYDSIEDLWEQTRADVIVIAVSELAVSQICRSAFKYPWLCLVEKPVGYDLENAREILEEAGKTGARAYVALNRRHYGSTRAVFSELAKIDGPRLVQVSDQENPQIALEAGKDPLIVKNWMYANSIHLIDYFRVFCRGDLGSVQHIIPWNPERPEYVLSKLEFSSGDVGIYQASWNRPGPWAVTISTGSKRFEMRPLEQATIQEGPSRMVRALASDPWDSQFKPGLRFQAEEIVLALQNDSWRLPTLAEGFATMELINKIYE